MDHVQTTRSTIHGSWFHETELIMLMSQCDFEFAYKDHWKSNLEKVHDLENWYMSVFDARKCRKRK